MAKKGEIEFSEEEILNAIPGTYGILSDIAKQLGCHRKTVERARDKYPRLKKALAQAREEFKDYIEGQLRKNLEKQDVATCIFAAKTVCRDRGYEEKSKVGLEGAFTIKWQGEDKKSGRDNGPV